MFSGLWEDIKRSLNTMKIIAFGRNAEEEKKLAEWQALRAKQGKKIYSASEKADFLIALSLGNLEKKYGVKDVPKVNEKETTKEYLMITGAVLILLLLVRR